MKNTLIGVACALSASAVLSVPWDRALASDGPTATLEEVVVTARKREENLQNVPVSIEAIDTRELRIRSLETLSDVGQSTPNVFFGGGVQAGSAGNLVYIRGVGQADPLAAFDPGVGIYIDGVYLGRTTGIDLDLLNVERVEVLRGPQGTLFGKNTNGGAISVVTKPPNLTAQAVNGQVQLTGGSVSRHEITAGIEIPVAPEVASLQLSGAYRSQNGYSHRIDGQQQADENRYDGRMALLVQPVHNFQILWTVDATTFNKGVSAFRLVDVRTTSAIPALYEAFTPYRYDNRWVSSSAYFYNGTGPNIDNGRIWGTALTLTWNTDWATIKSITAYRHSLIDNDLDPDGSPLTVLNVLETITQHQFSQELQATGDAFSQRLKWVTGLYYFDERVDDVSVAQVGEEFFHGAADFTLGLNIHNISYAAYGQGSLALTDQLNLTLGGRVTYERKDVLRSLTAQPDVQPSGNWTNFLPRVGLDYHFTPQVMGYISAAEGSKSGGFNGRAASVAEFNRFDPEKVWTYEVGARSDLFDKHLRVNATIFYSRYKDMQILVSSSEIDPVTGQPVPFNIVGNIPSANIRGAEVEVTAVPFEKLKIIPTLGITDGRYTTLPAGAPMTTGDAFINTPKVTAGVAVEYVTPLTAQWDVTGRVDYLHKSRIQYDYANSPFVSQVSYGLLNARLIFEVRNTGLSLSVFGTNLTNQVYANGGHDDGPRGSLGFVVEQMGAPREWGASVQYKF